MNNEFKYFDQCFSRLSELESFDKKAFYPDENVSEEMCSFILTLSLVYTDVKNVNLLIGSVLFSKPDGETEIKKEWGEFNGIINYLNRLNISILHELFNFIKKHKKILEDSFFREIIKSIRKEVVESWNALVEVSINNNSSNNLTKELMFIRNKISFHFDSKIIMKGYKCMFEDRKSVERGYISRGNNMDQTRFYFADGSVESYMHSLTDFDEIEKLYLPIRDYLKNLNISLYFIVINFIQKRGFGFRKEFTD